MNAKEYLQHWQRLQPRERIVLAFGAAALVLLLVYLLIVEPFVGALAEKERRIAALRGDVAWMEQAAAEVKRLQAARRPAGAADGRSLLTATDESARAFGLGEAVRRIQPDGQTAVRVTLEKAAFNDLLRWLEMMAVRQGATVTALDIEQRDEPGFVNARVALDSGR